MTVESLLERTRASSRYGLGEALQLLRDHTREQLVTWITVIYQGSVMSIHPDATEPYHRELRSPAPAIGHVADKSM